MTLKDIFSIVMEVENDEVSLLSPNSGMSMSNIRDDKQVKGNESPNTTDNQSPEDDEASPQNNKEETNDTDTDELESDGEGDEIESGEEDPQKNENGSQEEPDSIERKIRLRENVITLYGYISAAINKSVSTEFHGDVEYHKYFLYIQSRLNDCMELLYKLASEDIFVKPYIECLHRYITIKNIFDACIKMREKLSPLKDEDLSEINNNPKENREN